MTVLDFITQSAIISGVIEQGQTLSAEESASILMILNNMLDSWNTERISLYSISQNSYLLTANVGSYPIGPSATVPFNVARPTLIQSANILVSGLALPLDLCNSVQWAAITERSNVAILPTKLYYDNAFPIGNLNLNPVPLCTTTTKLELFAWVALTQFANTSATVAFPDGYMEPLQYSLSLRLYSAFALQVDPSVAQIALDAKSRLRSLNAQILGGAMNADSMGQVANEGMTPTTPQQ